MAPVDGGYRFIVFLGYLPTVAQYAGKHLHKYVLKRPEYNDNIEQALQQVSHGRVTFRWREWRHL